MNQYRPRINANLIQPPVAILLANGLLADHAALQLCYSKQAGVLPGIIVVAIPTQEGFATAGRVIVIDLHFESKLGQGSTFQFTLPKTIRPLHTTVAES